MSSVGRRPATSAAAEGATTAAGVVTLAIGVALTLAPTRIAVMLGLGVRHRRARAIGLADLALAPGLLAGRPRWPWMVARAGLNLVVARHYRAHACIGRRARTGAAAMTVLTVADAAVALILFASRR